MSLNFANRITICRILTVPFFISTLMYYSPDRDYLRLVALGIFCFAVISDVIDGYIARRYSQKTQAGAILDPLADKALLISAFICLYVMGKESLAFKFPAWFVVTMISRDVILLVGAMLIYIIHRKMPMEATWWGKASTFFQVVAVLGMLLQWEISEITWYGAVITAVVSGLDYIRNGVRLINVTQS